MRFVMLGKVAACLSAILFISGCATSAVELPRYVTQTVESGYAATPIVGTVVSKINVTASAVAALTSEERQKLLLKAGVQVLTDEQYGTIIDAQGVDQSTPGSRGGASLGGAVASAGYLDNALRGGNYSAVNQLAIGLLGAAVGSSLDIPATSRFQFRYTVKLGDGDIKYFDEMKSTAFRHSIGVCVLVPAMELVSTRVCNQTAESIRASLLKE